MKALALFLLLSSSYDDMSFQSLVTQRFDSSCGIACTITILNHAGIDTDAIEESFHEMYAREISFASMSDFMRGFGVQSRGFFLTIDDLIRNLESFSPIILHLDLAASTTGDKYHFVLVAEYDPFAGFLVMDPASGTRWWRRDRLASLFTGNALLVADPRGITDLGSLDETEMTENIDRARALELAARRRM